jgi:ribonuclease P protein component
MERLRERADFLAAAKGLRAPTDGFVLQARRRADDGPPRFGFTVSRKVGGAVERNRARRRLRDVVRRTDADDMTAGHDYVLVARRAAINLPFDRLMEEFRGALRRLAGRQRRVAAAAAPPDAAGALGPNASTRADRRTGVRKDS